MSSLLQYNGYDLVTIEHFGPQKEQYDVVLNCPHGFFGNDFLQAFPDIAHAFSDADPELFQRYLELEYDFASFELAETIAEYMSAERSVAVIFARCDRGILDANRSAHVAIRKCAHTLPIEKMTDMSTAIENAILDFCNKRLAPHGIFMDVHSMWPTSQHVSPKKFEEPYLFEAYIDTLINPKNQSKKRNINFLLNTAEGKPIAHKNYTLAMADELKNSGYPVDIDTPYRIEKIYKVYRYYQYVSGISMDIPRNMLGNATTTTNGYIEWKIDESKIISLATIFSRFLHQKTAQ